MTCRVNFHNEFVINVKPFSKSSTTLTFQRKVFSANSLQKVHSGIFEISTSKKLESFSELFFKPTYAELMLQLKLEGKVNIQNCSVGQIKIYTLLCLAFLKLDCVSGEPRRYLQWESHLTSDMILYSGNTLNIVLPGQIHYVQLLRASSERCCKNDTCIMQYRWKYIPTLIPTFADFGSILGKYSIVCTGISPSPLLRNWHQVKLMCSEYRRSMPMLFSYEDWESLKEHLRQLSLLLFVPNFFIGIQRMV